MSDGLNRKSVSDGLSRKSVSDGLKVNAQQLYMYGLKAQYVLLCLSPVRFALSQPSTFRPTR